MTFRPRSLRLRLLLLASVAIVVALGAAWAALTVVFDLHLQKRIDAELSQRWLELAAEVEVDANDTPRLVRPLADPRYQLPFGGAYWQVSTRAGTMLGSRSLLDARLSDPPFRKREVQTFATIPDPGGGSVDALFGPVNMSGAHGDVQLVLSVALGRAETAALQTSFMIDTAVALLIIGSLLGVAAWAQIWLGLRPLDGLRDELVRIHSNRAAHLEGRFPLEIEPLVSELNRLFDARHEQVRKARAQAGDLAHALKTPLTIVEGEADTIMDSGLGASAEVLRAQVAAMRRQVDRALARSRTHALATVGTLSTDLHRLADGLLGLMRRMPEGDQLTWVNAVMPGLTIAMDVDDAGECLGNLLDNARKWAKQHVIIEAEEMDGAVTISITDDGPGMSVSAIDALKRRGEQADPGRDDGSGLGLAIVVEMLDAYGSDLKLEATDEHGCRASFSIKSLPTTTSPLTSVVHSSLQREERRRSSESIKAELPPRPRKRTSAGMIGGPLRSCADSCDVALRAVVPGVECGSWRVSRIHLISARRASDRDVRRSAGETLG